MQEHLGWSVAVFGLVAMPIILVDTGFTRLPCQLT